jgi:hypothetical protein
MYENDKKDYVDFDEVINNSWRMRNEWPAIFGTVGDALSLFVLILSIVPSALFGALPLKLALAYFVYGNVLHKYNLTTKELFVVIKNTINKEKINVPSHRQSSFFAIPLIVLLGFHSFDSQAIEIIKAKEQTSNEIKPNVMGSFFIENSVPVNGHGDIDIKTLLDILVAKRLDYKIIYDDSEISEMMVSWRSLPPRELTIDQILGSISVRYGVYFYTTRGSSELHVAWLRDTAECKKRDGVYLRLCGTDAGKY